VPVVVVAAAAAAAVAVAVVVVLVVVAAAVAVVAGGVGSCSLRPLLIAKSNFLTLPSKKNIFNNLENVSFKNRFLILKHFSKECLG